jgi:sugar (pentulose or hexulose) kinase
MTDRLAVGVDVGTSGVRAVAITTQRMVVAQARRAMPAPETRDGTVEQDPALWWAAVTEVLDAIGPARIAALAVDGTSGTLLLADADGRPLAPARMYNDASAPAEVARIAATAPAESGAHGATSPLAWLLRMQDRLPGAAHALHQADWIAGKLTGRFGVSDDNNALKTGWDPVARVWPAWLDTLGVRRDLLPEVVAPGTAIGRWRDAVVVAGTTDGCAAFLATGAHEPGDGVTSLGTTLTLKLLSDRPVFDPASGVYSHRLGERWLAGGASNTGGAALLRFFTAERMRALEPLLRPDEPTGLDLHPLPRPGERFPVNDPAMVSRDTPRDPDDARFFQALLEGIAAVEARGYARLAELGAPCLRSVRTVGGGAANRAWTAIRARRLGVPMPEPLSGEAAFGAALLALPQLG